jgi:hypothetical protein
MKAGRPSYSGYDLPKPSKNVRPSERVNSVLIILNFSNQIMTDAFYASATPPKDHIKLGSSELKAASSAIFYDPYSDQWKN